MKIPLNSDKMGTINPRYEFTPSMAAGLTLIRMEDDMKKYGHRMGKNQYKVYEEIVGKLWQLSLH